MKVVKVLSMDKWNIKWETKVNPFNRNIAVISGK